METVLLARFRRLLEKRLAEAQETLSANAQATDTVQLDQQSVGRVSRMDALQQQAMARAQNMRQQRELEDIRQALERLDRGDFGYCVQCEEPISFRRLKADPSVRLCIGCASGRG